MKKLCVFVVAVMLALGFSSCDNGVHNSLGEFDGYSISGEGAEGLTFAEAGAISLVKTDDVYTVELVPTSSTISFCFVKTGGSWEGQLGGDVMSATTNIPIGIEFESVDNGVGGFNGSFKNLMAGTSYILIVDGNPSNVQLSLIGNDGIDGTAFYISFYTQKDSSGNKINESKNFMNADKKNIGHKMENKTFSFISGYTETLYYSVENAVTGEIEEKQKEFKNADEYLFKVEQNTTTKVFSVKCEEVDALENAVVISNSKHENDFYKEASFVGGGVYITAQRNEFEFYVQRKGSDDLVWAKDSNNIEADSDFVKLKYIDNRNINKDVSFVPTKITPVKVIGLKVGKTYLLSFESTATALSAKVAEAPYPNFDKYAIWSNVYGSDWSKGPNNMDPAVLPYPVFETIKEKENTYSLEFKPALDNLEFGLKSPESGNNDSQWREGPYNNGSWIGGGATLLGTGKTEFNPIGGGNSKITNLSPDTTYILTLVLTTPVTAEITVVEKN